MIIWEFNLISECRFFWEFTTFLQKKASAYQHAISKYRMGTYDVAQEME